MNRKILFAWLIIFAFLATLLLMLFSFKVNNFLFKKEPGTQVETENNLSETDNTKQETSNILSFTNFGDIMFDRLVKDDVLAGKNPFQNLSGTDWDFLRSTNFNIANLEGPISTTNHCQKKSINFEFNPGVESLIAKAGFNLLNLANNHAYDCYIEGAQDTAKYLDQVGIDYFGGEYIDKPFAIKEVQGKKIAFVGFYALLPSADIKSMTALVKKLKTENDFVVIDVHWGIEYQDHSAPREENIAHQWVDAGADIIIGHHPHVIQEMEIYKGKPIFYSLGNFVFDQNFGKTNKGLGVKVNIDLKGETKNSITLYPFNIISRQPTLYGAEESKQFCEKYFGVLSTNNIQPIPTQNSCEIAY